MKENKEMRPKKSCAEVEDNVMMEESSGGEINFREGGESMRAESARRSGRGCRFAAPAPGPPTACNASRSDQNFSGAQLLPCRIAQPL